MKFTGVTTPSSLTMCSLSSLLVIALAGPAWANDPHSSIHKSPHGSSGYSGAHHSIHGSTHMEASIHGDKHHSKGYPSTEDFHHGKGMTGHSSAHPTMGHGGQGSTHPGAHQSAIEFIDHILKFKEGMSLTDEQEQKLRNIKTNYKKERVKMKATVQLANIDLHELLRDDHANLSDIERDLKNVHALKADLFMASIKAKRDAKGVLSEEQQSRMEKIHERIKSHGGNPAHASGYSRAGKDKGNY
ncbi:Spy/CpxP family protein refolding chaperone [Candidatus Nitronereus thalassa]|uniref:Spy/CpxP family protein refolding chaperone n=1 Tax=Candidatus Nitronereus thalassa TaxID=3020898 RepID=A0ABU3K352_9BACT|nr:Spy/CpxP family protein refolding chaperone [Candidatus Nitronereus thalassa]MDT7040817.1 Spy/CpxP family protein refolding chaperone [Candidatus Nitronereus thalassa]